MDNKSIKCKRIKKFVLSIFFYNFLSYLIFLGIILFFLFLILGYSKLNDSKIEFKFGKSNTYIYENNSIYKNIDFTNFIEKYPQYKTLFKFIYITPLILLNISLLIIIFILFKINNKDNYLKYNIYKLKSDFFQITKNNKLIIIIIIHIFVNTIYFFICYNSIYDKNELINILFDKFLHYNISLSNFQSLIIMIVFYLILMFLFFIFVAFIEEYIYRYLYFKIFKNIDLIKNLIINSLIFSISHFFKFLITRQNYFLSYLDIFIFSFVYLSYIYIKTKNLLLVFIIHLFDNLFILCSGFIIKYYDPININCSFYKIIVPIWKINYLIWILLQIFVFITYTFLIKEYKTKS